MELVSLEIKDAFAFAGTHTIDFSKLDKHTQIVGYNLDEDVTGEASNGSGKTSIFLALQESIFGKNIKNTLKANIGNNVVRRGYELIVTFIVKDKLYKILTKRSVNGKATLILYENGVDISGHTITQTQKKIQKIIHLDYNLFTSLCYQSSSTFLNFLTTTDSERKKLLINLFNLDSYNDEIAVFKAILSERTKETASAKKLLEKCESDRQITIESIKKELIFEKTETLEKLITSIAVARENLAKIDEYNSRVLTHKKYKKQIEHLEAELKEFDSDLQPINKNTIDQTRHSIGELTKERKDLLQDIKRYSEKEKICPTCGQPITTEFNEIKLLDCKDKLKKIDIALEKHNKNLTEYLNHNKQYNTKANKESELHKLLSVYNPAEAQKEELDYELIENDINTKVAEKRELEQERQKTIQANKEIAAFNAKQELKAQIKQKAEEQYSQYKKEYDILQDDVVILKTLVEALKKLVSFKLESLLVHLQESINEYVSYLFSSDVALLITLKNDKLHFTITRSNIEIPVSDLSSGEFSRLQIAVLFAIRKVLTTVSEADINILFLDEILSSVDSIGREKLYELLESLPFKILSISHTYHENRLPIIKVIKEKGVSKIEFT